MKLKVGIVLLVALAIELVNWFFLPFPIDENIAGCHQFNVVMGCRRVDTVVLFAGGYLTTALLIFVVAYAFQQTFRLLRERSKGIG